MTVLMTLLGKILPLYLSILLGLCSTLFLNCQKETVAKILLYILAPVIVFNATASVTLDTSVIFLPLFFFTTSTVMAFAVLPFFKRVWHDNTANVAAFGVATGNTGNIGIPLAVLFLEPALVDVFIFTVLASILYQNSVGYYITAKGAFSALDSIKKVLKLPVLYAFVLGLIVNISGYSVPEMFSSYMGYLKGAYAIFGMMLLGMGMERLRGKGALDLKFLGYALSFKFIFWPLFVLAFIVVDRHFIGLLNEGLYHVMFLFSIVPLAGNTVTIATLLNAQPEKMALTVFLSTVISLVYIPMAIYLYGL